MELMVMNERREEEERVSYDWASVSWKQIKHPGLSIFSYKILKALIYGDILCTREKTVIWPTGALMCLFDLFSPSSRSTYKWQWKNKNMTIAIHEHITDG